MKKEFKEKIPVIITSLIELVILLRAFITPEKIVSPELVDGVKSDAGFGIFMLIITFAYIFFDEIKYNKKYILALNTLVLLGVGNLLVRALCIINYFLLGVVKSERRPKIKLKEVCKILEVEQVAWTKKRWAVLIILLVIYFGQNFIRGDWLEFLSPIGIIIYVIGLHVILIVLAIISLYKEIKEGTKLILRNFRLTIRYMLNLFVKMMMIMAVATAISVLVTNKSTSVNQETIESLPMYITIPLAVIWAPFVEEGVYRGGFRKFVKSKWLFVVLSGIVFGFLHAIEEATLVCAIATSLPYVAIGTVLAYSYASTNNIAVNILFHMLYNTLAVFAATLK